MIVKGVKPWFAIYWPWNRDLTLLFTWNRDLDCWRDRENPKKWPWNRDLTFYLAVKSYFFIFYLLIWSNREARKRMPWNLWLFFFYFLYNTGRFQAMKWAISCSRYSGRSNFYFFVTKFGLVWLDRLVPRVRPCLNKTIFEIFFSLTLQINVNWE